MADSRLKCAGGDLNGLGTAVGRRKRKNIAPSPMMKRWRLDFNPGGANPHRMRLFAFSSICSFILLVLWC